MIDDKVLIAKDTVISFTSSTTSKSINYGGWSMENPLFLCQLQTFDRKVSSLLRTGSNGPSKGACTVRFIPDTTDPDKTINYKNPFKETVGWICIGEGVNTGVNMITNSTNNQFDVQVTGADLQVSDASATWVKVYTLGGEMIAQSKLSNGKVSFPLNTLPAGVIIVNSSTRKSMKLVIKR